MCDLAAEAARRGTRRVQVDIPNAPSAKQRFGYCEGVELKYSALDTKYIPGLARPGQSGFLTPVFFAKDALTYFYHHPDYSVTSASDTYGTLHTVGGDYIAFGLNRSGKAFMWLGDLDGIPERDLKMLAVHNLESDHDIGSEFYEGQIEAEFTELSKEQRVVRAQGQFEGETFDSHGGLKVFQLEPEAVALMSKLRIPLHFTESEFGSSMEVMTKLFIERINVPALKENLRSTLARERFDDIKSYGSLKTLELWLGQILKLANAPETMMPLFVLYDLRVAYKHLTPAEKQEKMKASCRTRLAVPPESSPEVVYDTLVAGLEKSFDQMAGVAMSGKKEKKRTQDSD